MMTMTTTSTTSTQQITRQSIFLFLIFSHLSLLIRCCIPITDSVTFTDFAEKSDVVLRARALEVNEWTNGSQSDLRKRANFQVVGLFPNKTGGFGVGDKIQSGPFGRAQTCTNVLPNSQLILFLETKEIKEEKNVSREQDNSKFMSLSYNPVPASRRNIIFYSNVMTGNVNNDMKKVLSSGCRPLKIEDGGTKCNPTKQQCRILCRFGYQLFPSSSSFKYCNIITGMWMPQPIPRCVRSTTTGGRYSAGARRRQGIRTVRPSRRNPGGEEEEEEEEEGAFEEEEEEEEGEGIYSVKKSSKGRTVNVWDLLKRIGAGSGSKNKNSLKTTPTGDVEDEEADIEEEGGEAGVGEEEGEAGEVEEEEAENVKEVSTKPKIVKNYEEPNREILPEPSEKPTQTTKNEVEKKLGEGDTISLPKEIKELSSDEASRNVDPTAGSDLNTETADGNDEESKVDKINTNTESNTLKPPTNNYHGMISNDNTQSSSQTNEQQQQWPGFTYKPVLAPINMTIGCPTVEGTITIHSVWPGGFNGQAYFSRATMPLRGGWMAQLQFNVVLSSLNTFNTIIHSRSRSGTSFLLMPKYYAANLYFGQDLTIGFNGNLNPGISMGDIGGSAKLYGMCPDGDDHENVDILLPSDDLESSMQDAWVVDREYLALEAERRNMVSVGNQVSNPVIAPIAPITLRPTTVAVPVTTRPAITPAEVKDIATEPTVTEKSIVSKDEEGTEEEEEDLFGRCTAISLNGRNPVGGKTSFEPTEGYVADYNKVIHASILFYEAQRSGKLPENNRVPWRGDSNLKDGCQIGKDLSGGWYDGSGSVKTTFITAFSTTMLSWGLLQFKRAYEGANEYERALDQIRWSCDYLMRSHIGHNQLVVQVGKYQPPEVSWFAPEFDNFASRNVYVVNETHPGSDVAAEAAAALAAASLVFKLEDPLYSAQCLRHARQLHSFAKTFRGVFSDVVPGKDQKFFSSNNPDDELVWSAIWLYRATREFKYMKEAIDGYETLNDQNNEFFWDDKQRGITLLLARITKKIRYKRVMWSYIDWLQNSAMKTADGILAFNWNYNMHAANAAFLVISSIRIAENGLNARKYAQFARSQMELLLGSSGQSFVVGFGEKYPQNPHHRASSCPSPPVRCTPGALYGPLRNPHKLYGALVSGSDQAGNYIDRTNDDMRNDVSVVTNAGFQSLAAGLSQLKMSVG